MPICSWCRRRLPLRAPTRTSCRRTRVQVRVMLLQPLCNEAHCSLACDTMTDCQQCSKTAGCGWCGQGSVRRVVVRCCLDQHHCRAPASPGPRARPSTRRPWRTATSCAACVAPCSSPPVFCSHRRRVRRRCWAAKSASSPRAACGAPTATPARVRFGRGRVKEQQQLTQHLARQGHGEAGAAVHAGPEPFVPLVP